MEYADDLLTYIYNVENILKGLPSVDFGSSELSTYTEARRYFEFANDRLLVDNSYQY